MEFEQEDTRYCGNCKRDIASSNFSMHEVHCRRFMVLCKICEEPVHKDKLEEHHNDNHTETECDQCGKTLYKDQLDQHKEDDCPERMVHCMYCDLDVKACEYSDHEITCGSRTDECDKCKRRIMLRYMSHHMDYECVPFHKPKVNQYRKLTNDNSISKRPHHPSIPVITTPPTRNLIPEERFSRPPYLPIEQTGEMSPIDNDDDGYHRVAMDSTVTSRDDDLISRRGPNNPAVTVTTLYDRDDDDDDDDELMSRCGPISDLSRRHDHLDGSPSTTTMVLDPEWIGNVGNVVNDRGELDNLIARTVYREDLRKKEKEYSAGEVGRKMDIESDEEMARKLQEEYNEQVQLSYTDAALARTLTEDTNVVDSVLNDRDHAHSLYDGLREVPFDNDNLLVKQLQEEEHYSSDDNTRLSTMMVFDRSEIHQREEREKMEQIKKDHEFAAMMQEEEERRGPHYDIGVERDRPNIAILEPYEEQPHYRRPFPEDIPSPPIETTPSPPNEITPSPPNETTHPPPNETTPSQGIPCEICRAVVDFDEYQNHLETYHPHFGRYQSHGTIYCLLSHKEEPSSPSYHSSYHDPPYYNDHNHRLHGYGISSYQKQTDSKVDCEYCGFSFSNAVIEFHKTVCDENPEKYLKNAYHRQEHQDTTVASLTTCDYCYKSILLTDVDKHRETCHHVHGSHGDSRIHGNTGSHGNDDDIAITYVPCEHCHSQYPINEINKHEISCLYGSSQRLRNTLLSSVSVPPVNKTTTTTTTITQGVTTAIELSPDEEPSSSHDVITTDNTIPCEFCHKFLPLHDIANHQISCHFERLGIQEDYVDKPVTTTSTSSRPCVTDITTRLTNDKKVSVLPLTEAQPRTSYNRVGDHLSHISSSKPLNGRQSTTYDTMTNRNKSVPNYNSTSLLPSKPSSHKDKTEASSIRSTLANRQTTTTTATSNIRSSSHITNRPLNSVKGDGRIKQYTHLLDTIKPITAATTNTTNTTTGNSAVAKNRIRPKSSNRIAANFQSSSTVSVQHDSSRKYSGAHTRPVTNNKTSRPGGSSSGLTTDRVRVIGRINNNDKTQNSLSTYDHSSVRRDGDINNGDY